MAKKINRRTALLNLGYASGSLLALPKIGFDEHDRKIHQPDFSKRGKLGKTITAITLGAGNRGNVYGNYASKYPEQLDIVGVAEPISIRNERYCTQHDIKAENSFVTWEHVFEKPKFADAIIITTPDDLHYGPCMKALAMGYDVLLEKPIAPTYSE